MNLNFPSSFFKKLEIYQQIKEGSGIAKHKHLWEKEAAFLKWGYSDNHQHLKNFVVYEDVKKSIAYILDKRPENIDEIDAVIGNLYFKGFIEVAKSGKLNLSEADLAQAFGDYQIRPSMKGLEVGEVLEEIQNSNCWIKIWNKFKYEFCLKLFWWVLIVGAVTLIKISGQLVSEILLFWS